MAITAAQYRIFKDCFRSMLSVENVGPTEADVFAFCNQLFTDSTGAAALSTARQFIANEVFRTIISSGGANPTDANVSDFFTQLQTDSTGIAPMGQTTRYRQMRNALRAAMSGGGLNPSDADVLSYFGNSFYSFTTDINLLSWREPDNGLGDKVANNPWGAMTQPGGAVTLGGGLNGHTAWQFTEGAGKFLLCGASGNQIWWPPFHVFLLIKVTGTGAGNCIWANPINGVPRLAYQDSSHLALTSSGTQLIACTPANYNLIELFIAGPQSRVAVNNGAYTQFDCSSFFSYLDGFGLGAANSAGGAGTGGEVLGVWTVEGQASQPFKAGLTGYINSKFALSLPVAQPAFSVGPANVAGVTDVPFDFIIIAGASNNSNVSQTATTTPQAGVYIYGKDQIIQAMPALYDSLSGVDIFDAAALNTPASPAGGNAPALCNAIQSVTGRPLIAIVMPTGSSCVVPAGTVPNTRFTWQPSFSIGGRPVGAGGARNQIFNSAVGKAKDLIAMGGKYLFTWWWGDGEILQAQTVGDQWPTYWPATMTALHAAIGKAQRVVYAQEPPTVIGGSPNWTNFRTNTVTSVQSSVYRMVSAADGPYTGDGLGHVMGAGQNSTGAAAAASAIAAGWTTGI